MGIASSRWHMLAARPSWCDVSMCAVPAALCRAHRTQPSRCRPTWAWNASSTSGGRTSLMWRCSSRCRPTCPPARWVWAAAHRQLPAQHAQRSPNKRKRMLSLPHGLLHVVDLRRSKRVCWLFVREDPRALVQKYVSPQGGWHAGRLPLPTAAQYTHARPSRVQLW